MKEIVFVTGNNEEVKFAQEYFNQNEIIVSCIDMDFIEPNLNDIEYIAKLKAIKAYEKVQKPCIVSDAGFYIKNYPDEPMFPGALPKQRIFQIMGVDGLLEKMKYIEDRQCFFLECVVYYDGEDFKIFYGVKNGKLAYHKSTINNEYNYPDLWYVFIPQNFNKTLAEMTPEERYLIPDEHVDAFLDFALWYNKENMKRVMRNETIKY